MFRIVETIYDADGVMRSRQALGVVAMDRFTAVRLIEAHLASAFAGGKAGYECNGDYWWGCSDQPRAMVHRYTIEE